MKNIKVDMPNQHQLLKFKGLNITKGKFDCKNGYYENGLFPKIHSEKGHFFTDYGFSKI
ncbi:hypothetical protein SRABI96_00794 [Peribacillus sp. Bi96]|nr:hypothetical protein SRABI96_00794 [Peribacillus sp. Bi96]